MMTREAKMSSTKDHSTTYCLSTVGPRPWMKNGGMRPAKVSTTSRAIAVRAAR